jgi:dihydrofolate reductase
MKISAIAALSNNRVIGKNNRLPWHLPGDIRRFKEITLGHTILMGRKTYESIGRVLPRRENIIISRQSGYAVDGALVFSTIPDALQFCRDRDEIFVIGGAEMYQSVFPQLDRLYLTLIDREIDGDAFFPEIDFDNFTEVQREPREENRVCYTFIVLDAVRNA